MKDFARIIEKSFVLLVATSVVLGALAVPASAGHSACDNEQQDINLAGIAGVDGPPFDGNGEQVCVSNNNFDINVGSPDDGGVGLIVSVCHGTGSGGGACSQNVLLGDTGASVGCDSPGSLAVCLYLGVDTSPAANAGE